MKKSETGSFAKQDNVFGANNQCAYIAVDEIETNNFDEPALRETETKAIREEDCNTMSNSALFERRIWKRFQKTPKKASSTSMDIDKKLRISQYAKKTFRK